MLHLTFHYRVFVHCKVYILTAIIPISQDNARQNTMKISEQKLRGIKHCKVPSELDWQVHNLLAGRKTDNRSRSKKPDYKAPGKVPQRTTQGPQLPNPTRPKGGTIVKAEEIVSDMDGNDSDLDSDSDLVDLLTPHQYHQSQRNGFHDALEPMTIIEEFGRHHQPLTERPDHHDPNMEDEPTGDEYSFSRHVTSSDNLDSDGYDLAEAKQLQRELLLHDIQLKLIQRQNEDERMSNERELFRKQSILLDLQTTKARLELARLQPTPTHSDTSAMTA